MFSFLRKIRFYAALLTDRGTPWYGKLPAILGLLYILFPMDLINDAIPLLGWLDDLTIASLLVGLALRLVPADVQTRIHRKMYE